MHHWVSSWEEGQELPIGFTKKVIGFPRVANTCASCHTASYRSKPDENPTFVPTGPNHTLNLEAFFRFMIDCAKDPRFNPDNMMREINLAADLSLFDRMIYRFILIPITKKRLLEREAQFAWIYRKDFPEWGRGRDDAMNLTKYFMIKFPMDNTIGPTDMPSLWNLNKYKPEKGHFMNFAGDSHDPRSVIIDSALGVLGAAPHDKDEFLEHIKWFEDYLGSYPAPKYPFPIDQQKAAAGKPVFDKTCARCHASDRTGTRCRWRKSARTEAGWTPGASRRRSRRIRLYVRWASSERASSKRIPAATSPRSSTASGCGRRTCTMAPCPRSPTLLEPVERRPKLFYRGYDVYDQVKVGFVTSPDEAELVGMRCEAVQAKKLCEVERVGTAYDVNQRGSGNQGHVYGTDLATKDKEALVEYLKTL